MAKTPITLIELKRLNPKDKVLKRAVEEFKLTEDFREAGYILPDGKLLDLSGKREGGQPFTRSLDHREICRALDTGSKGISGNECMDFFERQGPVRFGLTGVHTRSRGNAQVNISLNTYQTPTEEQVKEMRRSIAVCRIGGPCDLAYDIFFDNGDRCIPLDEGFIENASQRDIETTLNKLSECKRKEDRRLLAHQD